MSHFEEKQADIKSRAPFSRHFWNAASQEHLFQNGCQNTQNGDLSNIKGSNGQYVRKEAIFDGLSTNEDTVDTLPFDDKDIIEG